MKSRPKNIEPIRTIVNRRINTLLQKAAEAFGSRPKDAKNYVLLAQKLSMRHRIPLGSARKKLFCKKCSTPWIDGKTLTISTIGQWQFFECACGAKRKFSVSSLPERN